MYFCSSITFCFSSNSYCSSNGTGHLTQKPPFFSLKSKIWYFHQKVKVGVSCLESYLLIFDNTGVQLKERITAWVRRDCQWENKCLWDACWTHSVGSVVGAYILDLTSAMVLSLLDIVQLFLWFCLWSPKAPNQIR